MQEIELSNDLNQIEFEIKQYENAAGRNFYEIGRRINWVKQNDLSHGEFLKFLKKIKMNSRSAEMFMKIAKDREIGNSQPDSNLGISVLYELTRIPNEMRNEPQQLDSGETKKPVDMTRREIQELNRKLKQSEEANKTLDGLLSEKADTISALEQQVKNKPKPEVVEKTVTKEVKPDDYEQLKQQAQTVSSLRNKNSELQGEIDKLNGKLSEMNSKGQEYEELQQKIKNLEYKKSGVMKSIDSGAEIISMNKKLKKMFDGEISSVRYRNFFADDPDNSIVDETRELIDTLQAFVDDMNGVLPTNDRKIIEGKFTE